MSQPLSPLPASEEPAKPHLDNISIDFNKNIEEMIQAKFEEVINEKGMLDVIKIKHIKEMAEDEQHDLHIH